MVLVALDKGLFEWLEVLELDVEGSDAFLNLLLLQLVEVIPADLVDNVSIKLVFVQVNSCTSRGHLNGIYISLGVLVLSEQGVVLVVHAD